MAIVRTPQLEIDHYAARFARYDYADRRSAFLGVVEALTDDQLTAPEVTVARLRAAVEALRQVDADGRADA